jgi:hypothetical protein
VRRTLRLCLLVLVSIAGLVAVRLLAGRWAGPHLLSEARQRFEEEYGPLRPELATERIPESTNSALLLQEMATRLSLDRADRELIGTCGLRPASVREPEVRAGLEAIARRNEEPLGMLDRAAERPDALFATRAGQFGGASSDVLLRLMEGGRLVRALAAAATEQADDVSLSVQLDRLATLARAFRLQRTLGFADAAISIERSIHASLHERATRSVPPEIADRWVVLLESLERAPDLRSILAGEATVADAVISGTAASGSPARQAGWYWPWTTDHQRADLLDLYADVATRIETPEARWPESSGGVRAPSLPIWQAILNPLSNPAQFSKLLRPMVLNVVASSQRLDAERALALSSLAHYGGSANALPPRVVWTDEAVTRRQLEGGAIELSLSSARERLLEKAADLGEADPRRAQLERDAARMVWTLAPSQVDSRADSGVLAP